MKEKNPLREMALAYNSACENFYSNLEGEYNELSPKQIGKLMADYILKDTEKPKSKMIDRFAEIINSLPESSDLVITQEDSERIFEEINKSMKEFKRKGKIDGRKIICK